ncbi:MAG: DUF805 domain-containing protein [Deferribacteraceae bacterium]|jgi:uncharacterized membrane protein YhaH (DUF805 family)|nr:DUF805 domain-containing protein [Deferribacteraceae bacterium]
MKCPKCGMSAPDNAVKCSNCGIVLMSAAAAVAELKSTNWRDLILNPRGRINRNPFWMINIWLGVMIMIFQAIFNLLGLPIVAAILSLVLYCAAICPTIKRLHDRDRSGWFALLLLVPLVNLWIAIEVCFLRGTVGSNRFGADPLN